jgi:hypothetical protein
MVPGGPNITAGMNPLVIMSIAYQLRTSHEDIHPPIPVRPLIETEAFELWSFSDGRHRWMGHWIAGRWDALCETE